MEFIIADLEWNGAYSKKAHGYFNEIIEIGAVKLNDRMELLDQFHAVIRPVISVKLSSIVKDLTNITTEELEEGIPFTQAVSRLKKWMGSSSPVLLTWSTTDLMVLMENCRYFYNTDRIPFMRRYADLQAYCQHRIGVGTAQQMGLSKACEVLGIQQEDMDLHRALDDSVLTARVMQAVYEPYSFADFVFDADEPFYERINFKTTIINDIHSPLVDRNSLRFSCPVCGRSLRRKEDWHFRNRAFCAAFLCKNCREQYSGRVQFKQKYEGVVVKRKLTACPAKTEDTPEADASKKIEGGTENGGQEKEKRGNR